MAMRLTYGLCTLVIVNLLFNVISPRAYIQMIHLELLLVLPDCCGLFLIIIIQQLMHTAWALKVLKDNVLSPGQLVIYYDLCNSAGDTLFVS